MQKYKLTNKKKKIGGHILYRIQALQDFGDVKKGDLGGWIEKEDNLSQRGKCWVAGNAYVHDNAFVSGDAIVSDHAWVYGNALVSGNARVYGNALVYGSAWVYGSAQVYNDARIYGDARVGGNAQVCGDAYVYGNVQIYNPVKIRSGYFYYTKPKSEIIHRIENGNEYETLCTNPVLEGIMQNKKVRIRLTEGTIIEGELIKE